MISRGERELRSHRGRERGFRNIRQKKIIFSHFLFDRRMQFTLGRRLRQAKLHEQRDTFQGWDKDDILVEPIKYHLSLKVRGRVFAYLTPRRKSFLVEAHNEDGSWGAHPITKDEDLTGARELVKANLERKRTNA